MDKKTAFAKASRYCAYQERTQAEVRNKLRELELWDEAIEEVIVELIQENFINEERFAKAYASGKFRNLKWGKIKIKQGLKQHGLSDYCIKKGLAEIAGDDYEKTITKLIEKKLPAMKEKNSSIRNQKMIKFLMGKGFEADIVIDLIKKTTTEKSKINFNHY
ncbi:MAG: regulatory protein RecX [Cytophagales bacterium]